MNTTGHQCTVDDNILGTYKWQKKLKKKVNKYDKKHVNKNIAGLKTGTQPA